MSLPDILPAPTDNEVRQAIRCLFPYHMTCDPTAAMWADGARFAVAVKQAAALERLASTMEERNA